MANGTARYTQVNASAANSQFKSNLLSWRTVNPSASKRAKDGKTKKGRRSEGLTTPKGRGAISKSANPSGTPICASKNIRVTLPTIFERAASNPLSHRPRTLALKRACHAESVFSDPFFRRNAKNCVPKRNAATFSIILKSVYPIRLAPCGYSANAHRLYSKGET